ncbi:MAG: PepSY domain-containing protein [Eubacterium sp.]|nr:PepSY domain-containing protein [Eubacterium sp.]
MMKDRKFMMLAAMGLILCLVMSVCLTACGGSAEAPAEEPAAEEPAAEEATEPAAEEPAAEEPAAEPESEQKEISDKEALEIAIKDAGVKNADIKYPTVEYDMDDGRQEYEVQFYVGTTEYEYTIDALTGDILERSMDND